jgi:hypothetical protein
MSVLDELGRLTHEPMRPGDDVYTAIPQPSLAAAAIDAVERRIGARLPTDLRTLVGACGGIDGLEWEVDFSGGLSFEMDHVFPHGLPIAGDHTGNFWVVDCTTTEEAEAAVFFACHDPPVMLWQCRGMATFLRELRRTFASPEPSSLEDVHEDRLHRVWATNPGALSRRAALDAADDRLRTLASSVTDEWSIVDLRTATPGMGFSWGRYGPRTRLRRHGEDRLFAYAPPERRPGVLARWFGR